ncbi:MAG: tetratricopeptide repeat protein [Acidobacteriota bacterium]
MSETADERFRRLERIFHGAGELEGDELAAYLGEACGGDPELCREAEGLLGVAGGAEAKIGAVVGAAVAAAADAAPPTGHERPPPAAAPDRVGVYRILDVLGEGGLGKVYLAERDDDEFTKRVAIKWLRPELVSPELERRFRLERQVLATLEHPYIARILDGGTQDGAAYLVMELVEGRHLLDHCRHQALDLREKLKLFRKICDAVHYAHRGLILHCDLKPSNIVVVDDGTPKLVDFGIAKALGGGPGRHGHLDSLEQATRADPGGFRPLTPDYASPEQVRYQSLTTATDIYSLGVVLYELLCGERPYRITSTNPLEIAAAVSTAKIVRPSHRFVSENGRRAAWGPDLDAVVMKALRPEPEDRYSSVAELSQDVLAYLDNRPVAARRGTWLYHVAKLARRHRLGAAGLAAVLLSLTVSTVVTSRQARVAERERGRAELNLEVAEEAKDRAEAVVDLLVGLFEVSHPEQALGDELTAREVLDQGSKHVQDQLKDRPQLRAALAGALGRVYRELALLDEAELHLADSLETRKAILAPSAPEHVEALYQMGLLRMEQQHFEPAGQLLESALALEDGARGPHSEVFGALQRALALCWLEQGRIADARKVLEESLADPARSGAPDSLERAEAEDLLSRAVYAEGDAELAETLARRSLENRRRLLGEVHPKVAISLNNLVAIRRSRGDLDGARADLEHSLEIRRTIYGDLHGAVALGLQNLAVIHSQQRDFDLADERLQEAERILLEVYGPDHLAVADVSFSRARNDERRGRLDQAALGHRRALDIRRAELAPEHPSIAVSLGALANSLRDSDPTAAESYFREALALLRARPDLHAARLAPALEGYGELRCRTDPEAGVELLREALEVRRQTVGRAPWYAALSEARLGRCLVRLDRGEGLAALRRALPILEAELGFDGVIPVRTRGWLEAAQGE